MNSTETLKLNKDFKRLYYRGKCATSYTVVIYAQKNRLGHSRVGLTCGKTVGKATKRNRAKRLMRECYRIMSANLKPGYDIVIVARTRIVGKKCSEVLKDVKYAFSKLGMIV
ncbi:MAG: ribonuclease P protein component [Clostridia bacterium]|nr:ribonuclease P protein component [Clostridia bacterium]